MQQVANDKRNAQPNKCARSRGDTHSTQQHNPAQDKGPKAVIAANKRLIWRPIVKRVQRLSIQGEQCHRAGDDGKNINLRAFTGGGELDKRMIDGRSLVKRRG